ncbi:MAG: MBL fold metallo-hydrolase [Cytophagales bacterium]|nr:MBL fold metallo-hydrolase [Armatimonadota bacterium]
MPPAASPPLSVTFLGTGTSTGVPMIGCSCAVCTSSDPRNKRMRVSVVVRTANQRGGEPQNLLVDTTPELRIQMLREGLDRVEAILMTHGHADHIFGLDDVRQINFRHNIVMPIYGSEATLAQLRRVFDYVFKETPTGGGKPQLDLRTLEPFEPALMPTGAEVMPLPVLHGTLPIYGYKFGRSLAYLTDVSAIPDETLPYLEGLDTLILGAVRFEPHPTHFNLEQALAAIAKLQPRRAFLTHLSHHFDHATVNATLPPSVRLAYDGLTIAVPENHG